MTRAEKVCLATLILQLALPMPVERIERLVYGLIVIAATILFVCFETERSKKDE